jgi:hypothetical protein
MSPLRPRIILLGLVALALPVMLALITYVLAGRSTGGGVGVAPQGPAGPVATVVTTTTVAPSRPGRRTRPRSPRARTTAADGGADADAGAVTAGTTDRSACGFAKS